MKNVLLLFLVWFSISNSINAQNRTITGHITDQQSNEALAGVSVKVKGATSGTATDTSGNFSLEVPLGRNILTISFVGYQTKDISVDHRSAINESLALGNNKLNEVVVVGYGTQKKTDLTGSISSVAGKELTQLPTQRVDQALQGRAAGVMVVNTDDAPGGNTLIRIRGMNSITGSNNALIVIDGLQGGNISSINPEDIASVEVLKDASATSIYGSRGANGVVIVTTKNGQKGKPKISYSPTLTVGNLAKKIPLMDAFDYAKNINTINLANNDNGLVPLPIFSDIELDSLKKHGGTNWQDLIYHTAITQNHQLSVNGGTDNLNYYFSGGYLDQKGILLNSGYTRYSLRAKLDAKIAKWLNFGLNWNGIKEETSGTVQGNQSGSAIKDALLFPPTIPVYDSNGNYSRPAPHYGDQIMTNPLASAIETSIINKTITNNINANLEFKLLEGLTLNVIGGAILENDNNTQYYNLNTFLGLNTNGEGIVAANRQEYYQNSNILTYNKFFNGHHKDDHKLKLTFVQEQSQTNSYSTSLTAKNFLVQQTNINDLGGASQLLASSSNSLRVLKSYLGRINYSFEDKYLVTASYRADGSSVFGANNKWGYFPSVSVAWNAFEEPFIKELNLISNLKFRGSWGVTGNQAINPYQTLASMNSGANYAYDGGDGTTIGFVVGSLANPNLKWESTSQSNIGIDLGLFNNRLSITSDYYKKVTKNLLLYQPLPGYVGIATILNNVGSMSNKGLEFAIGGDPIIGNFKWNTNFNISFNRTKVLSLGNGISKLGFASGGSGYGVNDPFMYLVPGQPFGQIYGWKFEGLWKTIQSKEAAQYGQMPGDPHYFDKNNDGIIDINDTTVIGNALPKYIFGWSNSLSYKNFNLSFLIEGRVGNKIFNIENIMIMANNGTSKNLLNRWTPQNQNSDIPPIINNTTRDSAHLPSSTILFGGTAYNENSEWIEDGSYARLKNVTLTYNLPQSIIKRLKIVRFSIFVSGSNLITLTKYSGYDPEVSSFTANDAQLGSDFGNYPPQRTYSFGLNVTF